MCARISDQNALAMEKLKILTLGQKSYHVKVNLKGSRMAQISASQHLPSLSKSTTKNDLNFSKKKP